MAASNVSTHTPHAGRDGFIDSKNVTRHFVSTHTPHAGRDVCISSEKTKNHKFLLTRPMRDVTFLQKLRTGRLMFLLTRPMRDVTFSADGARETRNVSTHTPHAGRDSVALSVLSPISSFLLTRPMRDVTSHMKSC